MWVCNGLTSPKRDGIAGFEGSLRAVWQVWPGDTEQSKPEPVGEMGHLTGRIGSTCRMEQPGSHRPRSSWVNGAFLPGLFHSSLDPLNPHQALHGEDSDSMCCQMDWAKAYTRLHLHNSRLVACPEMLLSIWSQTEAEESEGYSPKSPSELPEKIQTIWLNLNFRKQRIVY